MIFQNPKILFQPLIFQGVPGNDLIWVFKCDDPSQTGGTVASTPACQVGKKLGTMKMTDESMS